MKFTWLAAAAALAGWLIARRHKQKRWFQIAELVAIAVALLIGFGVIQLPNFEKVLEDVGQALGPWTYLAVGLLAFLETGAFLGLHRARRDRGDRRRPRRRPGPDLAAGADRDRLGLLPARRRRLLRARPAQGPRVAAQLRRAAEDHRGPPGPGRAAARQPRRGDDHRRALPRLRPPAEPVHRRRLADAVAALPPLRRARRRRVGDHVLHARLRVLALDRQAHDLRLARAVRARHARRADRRDRRADPPAPQPRGAREGARLDRRARRPAAAGGSLARIARPVWHMVLKPAAAVADFTRPLHPEPRHARQPRPGADDAARAGARSARSRSSCSATSCSRPASRGSTAGRPTSPSACAWTSSSAWPRS